MARMRSLVTVTTVLATIGIMASLTIGQEFEFPILGTEDCPDPLGCPDDHCRFIEGDDQCFPKCKEDQFFKPIFKFCVPKCDEDENYDSTTQKCNKKCGDEEEYNSGTQSCLPRVNSPSPDEKACMTAEDIVNEVDTFNLRSTEEVDEIHDNCPSRRCADYFQYGYRCVPNYICRGNKINTHGANIIDTRVSDDENKRDSSCCVWPTGTIDLSDLKCPKIDQVCCKHPDYSIKKCGTNSGCSEPLTKTDYSACGRIIGNNTDFKLMNMGQPVPGDVANPGEFPHMCLMYAREAGKNAYFGGATLIAPNKVLTVAHKFFVKTKGTVTDRRDSPNIYVRCGEHNVKLKDELNEYQESRVEKVHMHPDYNYKNVDNNLAILQLEKNLIYQKHIGPACLPAPGNTFEGLEECFSSGWGATGPVSVDDPESRYSDFLKKVKMHIEDRNECVRTWNRHPSFQKRKFRLRDSWMCVGGRQGEDTCDGDGGSPHVCNINDKWVMVGAVAFSIGCGDNLPAIYSSVSHAMCWIDYIMTCVPYASFNTNETPVEEEYLKYIEFRSSETAKRKSVNKLAGSSCQAWLDNNQALKTMCDIQYD